MNRSRARFVRAVPLGLCFCLLVTGCASLGTRQDLSEQLARAVELDHKTVGSIEIVLQDMLQRTNRFGPEERQAALDAVSRLRATSYLPTVREISKMNVDGSQEAWSHVVAVSTALRVLMELNDDQAVDLNRARLSSDQLRGFVVQNLRLLKGWSATSAVEAELLRMRITSGNGREVVNILQFLGESPNVTHLSCVGAQRSQAAYESCWTGPTQQRASYCDDLIVSSISLLARCGSR
jgi:hypothetical protein